MIRFCLLCDCTEEKCECSAKAEQAARAHEARMQKLLAARSKISNDPKGALEAYRALLPRRES
jgi:hypothetical protein